MNENYEKIKKMTIEELVNNLTLLKTNNEKNDNITSELYKAIFSKNGVDYKKIYELLPLLDEDDISIILKYDRNYKISFLLSLVDRAYEDDLTKQAIYLLKRYNLKYIIPLLPYIDEDEITEQYQKIKNQNIKRYY